MDKSNGTLKLYQSIRCKELLEHMCEIKAYKYRPDDPFTLVSGKKSPYYWNVKQVIFNPKGVALLARIFTMLKDSKSTMVGGVANAGYSLVPLVLANGSFAKEYALNNNPGFVVRKNPKAHGVTGWFDGCPPDQLDKVVMVEDVITTGGSVARACKRVEETGAEVTNIVTVIHRQEGVYDSEFEPYLDRVIPILTRKDFEEYT